jgi:hypothetical protein
MQRQSQSQKTQAEKVLSSQEIKSFSDGVENILKEEKIPSMSHELIINFYVAFLKKSLAIFELGDFDPKKHEEFIKFTRDAKLDFDPDAPINTRINNRVKELPAYSECVDYIFGKTLSMLFQVQQSKQDFKNKAENAMKIFFNAAIASIHDDPRSPQQQPSASQLSMSMTRGGILRGSSSEPMSPQSEGEVVIGQRSSLR